MRKLLLFLVLATGCGVELEHGLDERQANQVATVLETAGISADKLAEEGQSNTYKVVVSRAEAARAFQLLETHDLPRRGQKGLAETFADPALLPSTVEERARYAAALGVDLERTLEKLPGVMAARVHLALPAEDPLLGGAGDGARVRPTASVMVKASGLTISDNDLRRLVAGAVPSLQPADVSVVVAPLAPTSPTPSLDRFGPLRVAHESRTALATLATSGLVVILLLALAVAVTAFRLSSLRRRLKTLENG